MTAICAAVEVAVVATGFTGYFFVVGFDCPHPDKIAINAASTINLFIKNIPHLSFPKVGVFWHNISNPTIPNIGI
ncbi:hypothetical protein OB236_22410 [Paenibacillus sp. WQ 127069]|uniref:Uncharacterized protein n=1 Tax=Paenibacillus baimaensis TaxID=2982185 RepID=A0ABT2UJQ2_9BACL|nr:hypothetical protein [Paenibacillus sp. WQ 127069]MCU6794867.1 hypothetical protein [Paenibacillus sp. WQ 127069]